MTKLDLATPATGLGTQPRPIAARDAGTFAVFGLVALIVGAAALAFVMAPAQAPATTQQTTIDGYAPNLPSGPGGGRTADANELTDGWLTRYGAGAAPATELVDGWMTRFGAQEEELVDGWSVRYLVTDDE